MRSASRGWVVLGLQVVVVSLAVAGVELRRSGPGRCSLDGAPIEPLYRVRLVDQDGRDHRFCCVRCAQIWMASSAEPAAVFVTDEASGVEIPASVAWYVRSSVITQQSTRNRIHCFKDRGDAERHSGSARGRLLDGGDRPFSR